MPTIFYASKPTLLASIRDSRAYLRRDVIEPVADATVAAGLAKPIEQ